MSDGTSVMSDTKSVMSDGISVMSDGTSVMITGRINRIHALRAAYGGSEVDLLIEKVPTVQFAKIGKWFSYWAKAKSPYTLRKGVSLPFAK